MGDNLNALLDGVAVPDKVNRDHYGRYLLPDLEHGYDVPWTRATTIAGVVNTTESLEKWKQRNIVFGLGHRPDLYAQAAAIASTEERDALAELAEAAEEAGGSNVSSGLGTALHRFTERVDRGENVEVPEEWRADIEAYANKLAEEGIGVLDGFIERIVVNALIRTAGTLDRIIVGPWEKPRIADVKTGKTLEYSLAEYAVQQAIYARASRVWNPETKAYEPMPDVDQFKAMLIHVPAGQGVCHLYELDIAAGWQGVQLALAMRNYRAKKDFAVPYASALAVNELASAEVAKSDAAANKVAEKADAAAKAHAESPFPCEHCTKGYKSETGLNKHMDSVHPPEELEAHAEGDPLPPVEEPAPVATTVERQVDAETGEITEIDAAAAAKADADLLEARKAWIKARVKTIVNEGHGELLAGIWNENSPNVPTFKKGGPQTHADIDLLGGTCNLVESSKGMAFGDVDPAKQQHTNSQRNKELLAS